MGRTPPASANDAFERYYATVHPRLEAADRRRRTALLRIVATWLLATTVLFVAVVAAYEPRALGLPEGWRLPPLFALAALVGFVWSTVAAWHEHPLDYETDAYLTVSSALLPAIDASLRIEPGGGIGDDALATSGLVADIEYDQVESQRVCVGQLHGYDTLFAQVRLTTTVRRRRSVSNLPVFDGVVHRFAAARPFTGRTCVRPVFHSVRRTLLSASSREAGDVGPRRVLDPEFDRVFAVHAEDEHEARTLLAAPIRRRLLAYAARTRRSVRIAFGGRCILVAVEPDEVLFSPPKFTSVRSRRLHRALWERVSRQANLARDLGLEVLRDDR
jgi:hypothetical protein